MAGKWGSDVKKLYEQTRSTRVGNRVRLMRTGPTNQRAYEFRHPQ